MLEVRGDMFNVECDALCITTNGFVKKNGHLVMGRGCATTVKHRWPELPAIAGHKVQKGGNHVHIIMYSTIQPWKNMVTFPVKPKGSPLYPGWRQKAQLVLIESSASELVDLTDEQNWTHVVLPRPGCGNGGLDWNEVFPTLSKILDDRFTCMTF